jgi:hypothetical protein
MVVLLLVVGLMGMQALPTLLLLVLSDATNPSQSSLTDDRPRSGRASPEWLLASLR